MIEIKNLNFRYKSNTPRVLKDINIKINPGEKTLIAGKNGAGKTTLSKILSGIIPNVEKGSAQGQYLFRNRDINAYVYKNLVKNISILFQDFETQIISTSVKEELVFYSLNTGSSYKEALKKAEELAEKFGITSLLTRNIYELSGGEKQKIALLSLFGINPEVLILDEPFTDIEPASRQFILDFLKSGGYKGNIILFEQSLDFYSYFDRIIIINDGEIIYDGDKSAVKDKELLSLAGLSAPGAYKIFSQGINEDLIKERYYFDEKEYETITQNKNEQSETIVEAKNLYFKYEDISTQTIDNINFEIKRGDFVTVVGANGSGKTTLMKILAGILKPEYGFIFYKGMSIKDKMLSGVIGYVYQNPDNQIFAETVFDEIAFILKMQKLDEVKMRDRVDSLMRTMGLYDKKDMDPFILPKGDREKIACASIIVAEPEIIILDEPTTGLDYPSLCELMGIIEGLNINGHTILMITHAMETAALYGNKIMALNEGKIIFYGDKRRFFSDENLLEAAKITKTEIMELSLKLNSKLLLNENEFKQCWRER